MVSDDLLRYAINMRFGEVGARLCEIIANRLEAGDELTLPTRPSSHPVILDWKAALVRNAWAHYPTLGDDGVPTEEYKRVQLARLASELPKTQKSPFFSNPRPVLLACQDVWKRHGVDRVSDFARECWSASLIFSLDDYFLSVHSALRGQAFGLTWDEAISEFGRAVSGGGHISGRAKRLAGIDREKGRSGAKLEAIARREQCWAESVLHEARKVSYAEFLRQIFVCLPVFYTLRDIWWELHHLTGDNEFESLECTVDELQADIGQLMLMPHGGPVLVSIHGWDSSSVQARARLLRFWNISRVQLNNELYEWAHSHLSDDGATLASKLGEKMRSSLSEGQAMGLSTLEASVEDLTRRGSVDG